MKDKIVPLLIAVTLLGGMVLIFMSGSGPKTKPVHVNVPALSAAAKAGEAVFNRNCARCHGINAAGTHHGPPLMHKYYLPNHHPDAAFYRAAAYGVRAHHWRFGNMPPIHTVKQKDVKQILDYIRELQRANF